MVVRRVTSGGPPSPLGKGKGRVSEIRYPGGSKYLRAAIQNAKAVGPMVFSDAPSSTHCPREPEIPTEASSPFLPVGASCSTQSLAFDVWAPLRNLCLFWLIFGL